MILQLILFIYILATLVNVLLYLVYKKSTSYKMSVYIAFKNIKNEYAYKYFKNYMDKIFYLLAFIPLINIMLAPIYLKLIFKKKENVDILVGAVIKTIIKKNL